MHRERDDPSTDDVGIDAATRRFDLWKLRHGGAGYSLTRVR